MRVKEVAQALDQHPATVYRKVHSGEIPAVRLGSGTAGIRIPAREFEAWLYEAPGGPPRPAPGDRVERRAPERAVSTFEGARPPAGDQ